MLNYKISSAFFFLQTINYSKDFKNMMLFHCLVIEDHLYSGENWFNLFIISAEPYMHIQKTQIGNFLNWIRFIIFFLILFSNSLFTLPQGLVINEFLASNSTVLADPDFSEYSDWIEIANVSGGDIDISGYYLTDNLNDTTKWQFPAGSIVEGGGFILIWADGMSKHMIDLHAGFKLDKGGEEIGLFSSSKLLIDSVVYTMQETDISFGRQPDGDTTWYLFAAPTPGSTNISAGFLKAAVPVF
jgi:hypothetical protein